MALPAAYFLPLFIQRSPADAVTLLDICCGTGTIGQVMARHVDKVIGFELVESAVRDAEINAKLNGEESVGDKVVGVADEGLRLQRDIQRGVPCRQS